jgi:hypothetical protein
MARDKIPDNTTQPAPIVDNTQCNDVGIDLTTDENSNANINGNNETMLLTPEGLLDKEADKAAADLCAPRMSRCYEKSQC